MLGNQNRLLRSVTKNQYNSILHIVDRESKTRIFDFYILQERQKTK